MTRIPRQPRNVRSYRGNVRLWDPPARWCWKCKAFTLDFEAASYTPCPACGSQTEYLETAPPRDTGPQSAATPTIERQVTMVPEHLLEPTPERITALARETGGDLVRARHHGILEIRNHLRRLVDAGSRVAEQVLADFAEADAIRIEARDMAATASAQLTQLDTALRERGGLRKQIVETVADLEAASALLASPESLRLSEGQLVVASQKQKHLPAEIEALKTKEGPLTERIQHLAGELRLDLAEFLRVTYGRAARFERGSFIDRQWKELFEQGYLA